MFKSEGNRLIFGGSAGDDFLPVAAAIHNLAHKQGYQDVVLDFSKATYLHPKLMIPLVATARAYRREKVDFEILEPE